MSVLKTHNINKFFYDPVEVQVLKDITFSVDKGEFVSIVNSFFINVFLSS